MKSQNQPQRNTETKSGKALNGVKSAFYVFRTLWTILLLILAGVFVWAIVSAISAIGTELTAIFG